MKKGVTTSTSKLHQVHMQIFTVEKAEIYATVLLQAWSSICVHLSHNLQDSKFGGLNHVKVFTQKLGALTNTFQNFVGLHSFCLDCRLSVFVCGNNILCVVGTAVSVFVFMCLVDNSLHVCIHVFGINSLCVCIHVSGNNSLCVCIHVSGNKSLCLYSCVWEQQSLCLYSCVWEQQSVFVVMCLGTTVSVLVFMCLGTMVSVFVFMCLGTTVSVLVCMCLGTTVSVLVFMCLGATFSAY